MNELQIFDNPEFGSVRIVDIDGEGWFVGADVARALGYAKPQDAVSRHVDVDDSLIRGVMDKVGRNQQTKLINESGLYTLVIMSELPSAKKFKRWITSEVLPSIRKTGSYLVPQKTQNELILDIAQANVEFEKKLNQISDQVVQIEDRFETAIKTFAAPSVDHWKADMEERIDKICTEHRKSQTQFRGMLYKELETTANVRLNSRLKRYRTRMKKQGASCKERSAVSKIDIINKDQKLRMIFETIVKKHQALYGAQTKLVIS